MDEAHEPDPTEQPPMAFGYVKCRDCGTVVLEQFAKQTKGRCEQCHRDNSPLRSLELMHGVVRTRVKRPQKPTKSKKKYPKKQDLNFKAKWRAWIRLSNLFPDVFDMILDEERARIGLPPLARYEPMDTEAIVSKTLGFHDVYDALDSEGVTDA